MNLSPSRKRWRRTTISVAAAALFLLLPSQQQQGIAEAGTVPSATTSTLSAPASTEPGAVPPAGGLTTTIAETDSPAALLRVIPFQVSSLGIFDLNSQLWTTYIPDAPSTVNQEFGERLRSNAIVWVRRSPADTREGLGWSLPPVLSTLTTPQALTAPARGSLTVGVAGTTTVDALIHAQSFSVASLIVFDVASQTHLTYIPGAPGLVNTLPTNGLRPGSIVWMRRVDTDSTQAPSPAGATFAAVGPGPAVALDAPLAAAAYVPIPLPAITPTTTPSSATKGGGPTGGTATLTNHVTYEDWASIREGRQTSTSDGLGLTRETSRLAQSAGYALLRPGDAAWSGGGYRAEWHGDDHIAGPGTERWHGISYYFPADFNQGRNSTWNDRIIFQFADEGSPMFSLHLDAERKQLWVRRKLPERNADGSPRFQELARWSFTTGQWYDIAIHVRWTNDNSGIFELYVDKNRKVDYRGRTLAYRDVTYSKWGIYGQPTRLFFDEVKAANGPDGLDAVSP